MLSVDVIGSAGKGIGCSLIARMDDVMVHATGVENNHVLEHLSWFARRAASAAAMTALLVRDCPGCRKTRFSMVQISRVF
mmetsp:Transcript_45260/g.81396  ORF Transcript_45260/g.81396 Transcript_45260/m.81396 type:complete len:80 (-) Transcript_45260:196-435(-)